ncbi:hypothetical protein BD560DRAFT_425517 [Blakeslea trispora]|nr:hypothetical protein BD560DRAFT_425517 [Blakeslea trispora]
MSSIPTNYNVLKNSNVKNCIAGARISKACYHCRQLFSLENMDGNVDFLKSKTIYSSLYNTMLPTPVSFDRDVKFDLDDLFAAYKRNHDFWELNETVMLVKLMVTILIMLIFVSSGCVDGLIFSFILASLYTLLMLVSMKLIYGFFSCQ